MIGEGLGHDIALFLEIARDEDHERDCYHGEDAVHANHGQRIANNIGDEGGTDGQT